MNETALGIKPISFCLGLLLMLSACSTDIDLYADYKQVPIIYGLLDANADTNFIKITRAFYVEGDAYQAALNPDSSNYPGKLDVRLVEFRNGDSIREIVLDTITLHNKQPGVFYHPDKNYTTLPNGSWPTPQETTTPTASKPSSPTASSTPKPTW